MKHCPPNTAGVRLQDAIRYNNYLPKRRCRAKRFGVARSLEPPRPKGDLGADPLAPAYLPRDRGFLAEALLLWCAFFELSEVAAVRKCANRVELENRVTKHI